MGDPSLPRARGRPPQGCRHDRSVLVTLILRLVAEHLAEGEVVGEVEDVGGAQLRVHGVEELMDFARSAAVADQAADRPS